MILNGQFAAVYPISVLNGTGGVRSYAAGNSGIGLLAFTDGDATTIGVSGLSEPDGIGVMGRSVNGTGVHAEITGGGYALDVQGRAVFNRSGKVTFSSGQASRSVTRTGNVNYLGPNSIVVATIQGYVAGTWVAGVHIDSTSKFTIRLNKAAPKQLVVGFFIVN